jgi:tRNA (cytidine32/uridine32-2'-O)-methyltransferase
MLQNIKIILIEPQTPGNIGAVARAMKTMGLSQLVLVRPSVFPHKDAYIRATHATTILDNCLVADNFTDVIKNCSLVIGTSIRDRGEFIPALSVKETAIKIIQEQANADVALVFGTESHGMTGEDIRQCNYYGYIPSNPDFSSLNLASAVQIFCYEIFQEKLLCEKQLKDNNLPIERNYPSNKQLNYFYKILETSLSNTGFIRAKHPGIIIQRLRGIFNRARIDNKELNILMGILSSLRK